MVPTTASPARPPRRRRAATVHGPEPTGCVDPDPQVVATCLAPISAVAVLPDARTALVAERTTGRVLRVQRGVEPTLVTTVPVDPTGGGGLTGLVLSPGYAEDRLVYAYATTPTDNRVLRLAPGEEPKPVLAGIPRGGRDNGGALPRTAGMPPGCHGAAGSPRTPRRLPASSAHRPWAVPPRTTRTGRRRSTAPAFGHRAGSARRRHVWITDKTGPRDVLYRATPGPLADPSWTWRRGRVWRLRRAVRPAGDRPDGARSVFVLRPGEGGTFTGDPETLLENRYGRLQAAAAAPDGLLWLGTTNKVGGGRTVPSDDRVIRIQPPSGGGESRI